MGTGCGKEGNSDENATAGYAQTYRAVQTGGQSARVLEKKKKKGLLMPVTVLPEKTSASSQGRWCIQEYQASVLDTIGRVLCNSILSETAVRAYRGYNKWRS